MTTPAINLATRHRFPLVTLHEHGGWARFVRSKWRCSLCGHRLTTNGVAPIATRRQPWRAPFEWIDRSRAKAPVVLVR